MAELSLQTDITRDRDIFSRNAFWILGKKKKDIFSLQKQKKTAILEKFQWGLLLSVLLRT